MYLLLYIFKYRASPRKQPFSGYVIFLHKVSQPGRLKYIPRHILFEGVHIPAVDFKLICKSLLPPYLMLGFKII